MNNTTAENNPLVRHFWAVIYSSPN